MDDSDSFFENSEIEFVNNEHTGKIESKIDLVLLTTDLPDNGSLQGFIKILTSHGLKDGKIFIRLATIEESVVERLRIMASNKIEDEIGKIKKIEKNEGLFTNARRAFAPFKKGTMLAKLNRVQPQLESSVSIPAPISAMQRKSRFTQNLAMKKILKEVFNQPDEHKKEFGFFSKLEFHENINHKPTIEPLSGGSRNNQDVFEKMKLIGESSSHNSEPHLAHPFEKMYDKSSKLIFRKDFEVFSMDRTIENDAILILPFSIELECVMGESCEYKFSFSEPVTSPARGAISPGKKTQIEANSTKRILKNKRMKIRIPIDFEPKEHISVWHRIECYYLTNAGFKMFKKEDHTQEFDGLEVLKETGGYLHTEKRLQISRNPLGFNRNKVIQEFNILEYKYGISLKCFLKKYQVKLYLDKTLLSQEEKSINLILSFDSNLISVLNFIDVILYCENLFTPEPTEARAPTQKINQVHWLLRDSLDIKDGIPKKLNEKRCEYVGILDLSKIRKKLHTIKTPQSQINFYAKFFLSNKPYNFSKELMTQELIFINTHNSFSQVSKQNQMNFFQALNKKIDKQPHVVKLPFTEINMSEDYEDFNPEIDQILDKKSLPQIKTSTIQGKSTTMFKGEKESLNFFADELANTLNDEELKKDN